MGQDSSEWAAFRPDIIGSVAVGHEGGAYTMALYFTAPGRVSSSGVTASSRGSRWPR
jgi:hypothetical protein